MIFEAGVIGASALFVVGWLLWHLQSEHIQWNGGVFGHTIVLPAAMKLSLKTNAMIIISVVGTVFIVGLFVTFPVPSPELPDELQSYNVPIYSSVLTSQTSGSFFLGCGEVKSEFVYIFYKGAKATGLTLDYYPTSSSTIFLDEDQNPYVKVTWMQTHITNKKVWGSEHYDFHLPENSIVQKYNMSLR